jgi:hypothetical protein
MHPTITPAPARTCRLCDAPLPPAPRRGRPPVTCSASCQRAARAADARARRAADRPTPAPEEVDPVTRAAVSAWFDRREERHAYYANRYETLRENLASASDFQPSDLPADAKRADRIPLADMGVSTVSRRRDGSTRWESDPSDRAAAARTAREHNRIREECRARAVREAKTTARAAGIFLFDGDPELDEAIALGDARADDILSGLSATFG